MHQDGATRHGKIPAIADCNDQPCGNLKRNDMTCHGNKADSPSLSVAGQSLCTLQRGLKGANTDTMPGPNAIAKACHASYRASACIRHCIATISQPALPSLTNPCCNERHLGESHAKDPERVHTNGKKMGGQGECRCWWELSCGHP